GRRPRRLPRRRAAHPPLRRLVAAEVDTVVRRALPHARRRRRRTQRGADPRAPRPRAGGAAHPRGRRVSRPLPHRPATRPPGPRLRARPHREHAHPLALPRRRPGGAPHARPRQRLRAGLLLGGRFRAAALVDPRRPGPRPLDPAAPLDVVPRDVVWFGTRDVTRTSGAEWSCLVPTL